jgi:hypothetical protein
MSTPKVIMTARESTGVDRNVTATTPEDMPNIRVEIMTAAGRVLVRAFRTFLQAFLATFAGITAGPAVPVVSDVLPPSLAGNRLVASFYLAAIAAVIAAIQLTIEISAKWDVDHPELLG